MYRRESRRPSTNPSVPIGQRVWYNPYEPPPDHNWFLSGGGLRWSQPSVSPETHPGQDDLSSWVLLSEKKEEEDCAAAGTTSQDNVASAMEGIEDDYNSKPPASIGGGGAFFPPILSVPSTSVSSCVPAEDEQKKAAVLDETMLPLPVQPTQEDELAHLFSLLARPNAAFENLEGVQVDMAEDANGQKGSQIKKTEGIECKFFEILSTESITLPFCALDDIHGRLFYLFLKGDKDERKLTAMNNCMKLYVLKTLHRIDGRPYQPNGVMTRLRTLFALFKRKGIQFSMSKDFNFQGGFALYLEKYWARHHSQDATFGSRPTKKSLPDNYGDLVRCAVKRGLVDASGEHVYELLALFAFSLGTMFGFRGVKVRCNDVMFTI
jgi:hypothetical protein